MIGVNGSAGDRSSTEVHGARRSTKTRTALNHYDSWDYGMFAVQQVETEIEKSDLYDFTYFLVSTGENVTMDACK